MLKQPTGLGVELRGEWVQAFHNYDPTCDIFNHSNLIYWQISLPGLDGWNNVSCTGTNFVVRARAAQEVRQPNAPAG